ncbi:MAG TPA: phage tail assembly protein [Bradyrhizobium sp.]|nr:phage tail assembly protein [Bradyrhizobium sp.]
MTQDEIDALPDTLNIPLKAPIIDNRGEQVSVLCLREPTGAEMKQISARSGLDSDYFAIALMAGVPQSEAEKLSVRILTRAAGFLEGFTRRAQPQAT